jgi:hypothetical protein
MFIIHKGGPCGMALCPYCMDVDVELAFEDTYFKCSQCGLTGDITKYKIVDCDDKTPPGYKSSQSDEKNHYHSFHGYPSRCWIIYDTNKGGYAETVFAKEEDAVKYLAIRKHAGWRSFEIMERHFFKDAILGIGPSLAEKHPGCDDCQTRSDDESFIVEQVLATPPYEEITQ